jgi:hypothetical protein
VKEMKKKCAMVETAERLAKEIEAEKIPDDFKSDSLHEDEILAEIRHEYTNYDTLLYMLPLCVDMWNENPSYCKKVAKERHMEEDQECPLAVEAHDILKWKAKEKARIVYSEWLKKRTIKNKRA